MKFQASHFSNKAVQTTNPPDHFKVGSFVVFTDEFKNKFFQSNLHLPNRYKMMGLITSIIVAKKKGGRDVAKVVWLDNSSSMVCLDTICLADKNMGWFTKEIILHKWGKK